MSPAFIKGLIVGVFIGAWIGLFITSLLIAASKNRDERI